MLFHVLIFHYISSIEIHVKIFCPFKKLGYFQSSFDSSLYRKICRHKSYITYMFKKIFLTHHVFLLLSSVFLERSFKCPVFIFNLILAF